MVGFFFLFSMTVCVGVREILLCEVNSEYGIKCVCAAVTVQQ